LQLAWFANARMKRETTYGDFKLDESRALLIEE